MNKYGLAKNIEEKGQKVLEAINRLDPRFEPIAEMSKTANETMSIELELKEKLVHVEVGDSKFSWQFRIDGKRVNSEDQAWHLLEWHPVFTIDKELKESLLKLIF